MSCGHYPQKSKKHLAWYVNKPLSIMILNVVTLSKTILNITALSITILNAEGYYAVCRFAECCSHERHYAECCFSTVMPVGHFAYSHYECHYAKIIIPSVTLQSL